MERGDYDIINPATGVTTTVSMTVEEAIRCTNDFEFAQQIISRQALEESMILDTGTDNSEVTENITETITIEEVTEETQSSAESAIYRWREANIYLLLGIYEELQEKFADPKISQKRAWNMVSEEIAKKKPNIKITGPQCMTKMRSLKKIFKNVKDHNSKSGNDRRTWKYYDRMNEIFGSRAWATPVSLVTSEESQQPTPNESVPAASASIINQSPPSTAEPIRPRENRTSLIRILELKMQQRERHEAARQRRHEERLASDQMMIQTLKDFMTSGQ